jgi:hypothetical protein
MVSNPVYYLRHGSSFLGSLLHVRALDKHMIVLNSVNDAIELLDKRSNNYSDRPYFPMLKL